ncbi:ATP-binding protein [Zhouia sp. PK063]|uniref:HAMP domain-containing sensor histidine kinase n=1 Tax=Zhouia sp. PK063 TaxID=3373602 RepID=UPI003790A738
MKTQNKIILFFTSITFTYILIFSLFIYYLISNYTYTDFYKRLEIRAITMAKIELEEHQDINAVKEIRREFLEPLQKEQVDIHEVSKINSHSENIQIDVPKKFINNILKNERAFYKRGNTYYSGIIYNSQGKNYIVIVSAQNYYNSHHIAYLRNILIIAIAISIIIIVTVAVLFSKMVVKPIQTIIDNVNKISSENMNLRLAVPNNNNELRALTHTFNDMLNRLETSFETQKNFISNASHELNTPLTSIIGEADVILAKPRSQEEYIHSLQTILEEAEKLNKKTKALLFLAQTGYNGKIQKFEIIRIDQLIIDVKQTVEKIYQDSKIHIDFSLLPESSDKLNIKANEQLLHLAISNVLLNACKYSVNKEVKIAIGISNNHTILVIKDNGIGIPEKELSYIYDPFFRASNTRNFEGYGIGLPLTRNVIKMHEGELFISSKQNEGTTVEIRLPIYFTKD